MDTLYEKFSFNWNQSLAGPQSDPCRMTRASHELVIRHVLNYFLHGKHLSPGLKYRSAWAPPEAELAGDLQRDVVCLVLVLFPFVSPPYFSSELLGEEYATVCHAGGQVSRHWNAYTSIQKKRGKGEKIDHFLRLAVLVQPNVLTYIAAIQSAFTVPNFVYIQVLYLLNTTGHLKLTKKITKPKLRYAG